MTGWNLLRLQLAALLLCISASAGGAERIGIPLKPDPPFAIDGDLEDWASVPGAIRIDQPGQAVHGAGDWSGPADLSATIKLAWRQEHLFLAADVTDDQIRQSERGASLWKGDHIELYLDAMPELEPDRTDFGQGQFQFGFSPGNFLTTGDALTDVRPEAFCYRPTNTPVTGVEVAARRTATGYTLEAAVPWALLGLGVPTVGTPLAIEVGISDTDSNDARQESMLVISEARWARTRARLLPAALAGSDGVAPELVREFRLLADDAEVVLQNGERQTITFEAGAIPEGREAVLLFQARLHSRQVAGHTAAVKLALNGQELPGDRLLDRPARVTSNSGRVYSMWSGSALTTYYSPDFDSPNSHPHYGLVGGVKPCYFQLRVTPELREGANELVITHGARTEISNPLHVAGLTLAYRLPPPPPREKAGPPTGELQVRQPIAEHRTAYQASEPAPGTVRVQVGDEVFDIVSRFSTPRPGWVHGTNDYFDHRREVVKGDEAVVVRDTFTNRTAANLGIMQRHELAVGDRLEQVYLGGLPHPLKVGKTSEASNPTSFGATATAGLGLVANSDVLRLHVANYCTGELLGLSDDMLVLPPGESYTAQFLIIPTAESSYWRFINAARRLTGANFLIDGGFAFFRAHPELTGKWSDEQTRRFIELKDARYVCASIGYPYYKGRIPHGTAFQTLDYTAYREAFARRRQLVPGVQNLIYFHCFIDVHDDAPELFADSKVLRPDGGQADYGKDIYKIFMPTETNSYGAAVGRNIDLILDDIGAEGVYWDEHQYSRYQFHYGEPWDRRSGDIDPATMQVSRLKSSVTLLTENWRVALTERIMARAPLIGNGTPVTDRMRALRFPCFVETGSITNCTRSQLYSPIALGDHLTERSQQDAYEVMLAALDYGCVYHWYNDVLVIPTHHTLTRYMYPITPLELHPGYIIGQERIITKVSGLFGWGDASGHEVHVFNDQGVEVADFVAPRVVRDGRVYTELRIGEDWSAAIVRQPAAEG